MKSSKILLAGILVLLITGCSAKESKLTCTQTTSGVDVIFTIDFKGNVIENMDINYNMDLSKYSDAQITAVAKDLERYPDPKVAHSQHLKYLAKYYFDLWNKLRDDFVNKYETGEP